MGSNVINKLSAGDLHGREEPFEVADGLFSKSSALLFKKPTNISITCAQQIGV